MNTFKYVQIVGGQDTGLWYSEYEGEHFRVRNVVHSDINGLYGRTFYMLSHRPYKRIYCCHCLTRPRYKPSKIQKKFRGIRQIRKL